MAAVDAPGHSASLPRLFGSQLPIDLLDHILSYLPLFSVGVMTRLSSSFFALLNRDSFWRAWVRRHYGCSIPAASFGSKLMGLARIEWIAFDLLNAHRFSPLSILRTMPRGHVKTFVKIIYTLSAPQVLSARHSYSHPCSDLLVSAAKVRGGCTSATVCSAS